MDWSLHRQGAIDQARHHAKIKEAIRKNLFEIVSQETIISQQGKKTVTIPIRTLELYRFRYHPYKGQRVGQGDGHTRRGTVIGQRTAGTGSGVDRATVPGEGGAPGEQPQAGNLPGVDYYEAEIEIDQLAALLFEELGLPFLEPRGKASLRSPQLSFTHIARHGPLASLDRKRTILQNLRRNALAGRPVFGDLKPEDLRFRVWRTRDRVEHNAVVLALRDVSASMGEFEKFVSRSFFFWTVQFLRRRYGDVEMVFITHHTEAREVDEEAFFQLGQSGGTRVSSAYRLALEVITRRYPPHNWNIYLFHFSDGENYGSGDNARCVELLGHLLTRCNLIGYGEVRPNLHLRSPLMTALRGIKHPRLATYTIRKTADIYAALRTFFSREGRE